VNSEQQFLLNKAEESLQAAKLLADNQLYDFSVSRSYYAMFYLAQIFLLGRDLSFSSHAAVISAFGREFVKSGEVPKELHRYLIDAAKARTDGDYSTEIRLSQDDAIVQMQRAQSFLDITKQSFL
jgi:uncharacterized protein (UPF0332 family)